MHIFHHVHLYNNNKNVNMNNYWMDNKMI